jgi:hypothetical protein
MKAIKTKKGFVTLSEIDQEDWLFMRAEYESFSKKVSNNFDRLLFTILQEFFQEKHSSIYLERLPTSVKLKNYEAMAFCIFLANRPYYGTVSNEITSIMMLQ